MRARYLVPLCVAAVLLGGSAAWAEDEERERCVEACYEVKAQCVTACGTHDDPIECDAECQEAAQECIERCD